MPTPGYYFRDGGTTPPAEMTANPDNEFRQRLVHSQRPATATGNAPLAQQTTTSHQLATGNHKLQGAAQEAGKEDGTTNLGWQKNAKGVDTLVGGISNEDLWMLIRRFNKASRPLSSCTKPLTRTCSKHSMSRPSPGSHPVGWI